MNIIPYTCIRCKYKTKDKTKMYNHFYKRKKNCPGTYNIIELTEIIKQHILENRIYKMPKTVKEPKAPTIIQNIQNNNTINNFIGSMDTFVKLEKLMNFKQIELTGLEFDIENKYSKEIAKLEGNKYKYGFHLDENDFLTIVDNISKVSENFDDFNVLYDADMNKVRLFRGSWDTILIDAGIKELIQLIQDSYLYVYELYLLKNIYGNDIVNLIEKQKYKENLEDYFKFLNIFDIQHIVLTKLMAIY